MYISRNKPKQRVTTKRNHLSSCSHGDVTSRIRNNTNNVHPKPTTLKSSLNNNTTSTPHRNIATSRHHESTILSPSLGCTPNNGSKSNHLSNNYKNLKNHKNLKNPKNPKNNIALHQKRHFLSKITDFLETRTSLLTSPEDRAPDAYKYLPQMLQAPKQFEIDHFLATFNSRKDPIDVLRPQTLCYLSPSRNDYPFLPVGNMSDHHELINVTLSNVGSVDASPNLVGDDENPKSVLKFITKRRQNAIRRQNGQGKREMSKWEEYMTRPGQGVGDDDDQSDFDDDDYYDKSPPSGKATAAELDLNNHFFWNYDIDQMKELGMSYDVKGEYIFNHQPITNAPLTVHHLAPISTGRIAYLIADHPNRTNEWKLPYLVTPKHSVGEFWSQGTLALSEQDEYKYWLNKKAGEKHREDLYNATHPTYLNSKWIQVEKPDLSGFDNDDNDDEEEEEGEDYDEKNNQDVEGKKKSTTKVPKKVQRSLDRLQFYKKILPHGEFENYQRVHRAVHEELKNYDEELHRDLISRSQHEKNLFSYLKRIEKSLSPNRRGTPVFQHRFDQVWYPTTFNEPKDGVLTSFQYPLERGITPENYPGFPFLPLSTAQRVQKLKEDAESDMIAFLQKQEMEKREREKREKMVSTLQNQSPTRTRDQNELNNATNPNMVNLFTENITPTETLTSIRALSQTKMIKNGNSGPENGQNHDLEGFDGREEGEKGEKGENDGWDNPFRHYTYENYLSEILPHQFRTQFHDPIDNAKDLIKVIKQNLAGSEAKSAFLPSFLTRELYTAQFPLDYVLTRSPNSSIHSLPQLHPRHKQQFESIVAPSESILRAILYHLSSNRVQYQFMPPHLLQAIGPATLENLEPTITKMRAKVPMHQVHEGMSNSDDIERTKIKATIEDYFNQCIINNDDPKTVPLLQIAPLLYHIQPGDHDRVLSHPFVPQLFHSLRHFVYQNYNPVIFSPEHDGIQELELRLFSNFSIHSDEYLKNGWVANLDKKIRNTKQTLDLFAPDGSNNGSMSPILKAILNRYADHRGDDKVLAKKQKQGNSSSADEGDQFRNETEEKEKEKEKKNDNKKPFDISTFNLLSSILDHPAFAPLSPDLLKINDFCRHPSQPAIIHGCVINPTTRELITAFTATYGSPYDPTFYGGLDGFTSEMRLYEILRGELGNKNSLIHNNNNNNNNNHNNDNDTNVSPNNNNQSFSSTTTSKIPLRLMSQSLSMGPDHQVPHRPDMWDLPGNVVSVDELHNHRNHNNNSNNSSTSSHTSLSAKALGVGIGNTNTMYKK